MSASPAVCHQLLRCHPACFVPALLNCLPLLKLLICKLCLVKLHSYNQDICVAGRLCSSCVQLSHMCGKITLAHQ